MRAVAVRATAAPEVHLAPRPFAKRASGHRKVYSRRDLTKYRLTDACVGCTAAALGAKAKPHADEFREESGVEADEVGAQICGQLRSGGGGRYEFRAHRGVDSPALRRSSGDAAPGVPMDAGNNALGHDAPHKKGAESAVGGAPQPEGNPFCQRPLLH